MKISVVIPFLDEFESIGKAVHSVLNQDTEATLEIIVVIDQKCSLNDLGEFLPGTEMHDSVATIRVIKSHHDLGAGYNRQLGVDQSTGEYVAFLDADDEFLQDKIRIQVGEMERIGGFFSYSSYVSVRQENAKESLVRIANSQREKQVTPRRLLFGVSKVATPTVVIRRDESKTKDLFPFGVKIGEDYIAWARFQHRLNYPSAIYVSKPLSVVNIRSVSANRPSGLKQSSLLKKIKHHLAVRKTFRAEGRSLGIKEYPFQSILDISIATTLSIR